MEKLRGIAVSPGLVIGRVFVHDDETRRIPRRRVPVNDVPAQHERLSQALEVSIEELTQLVATSAERLGHEASGIFSFHMGLLRDASLTEPMHARIESEHVTAEFAAYCAFRDLADRFRKIPDPTFQTKVDDVRDLAQRVIRHLIGEHDATLREYGHDAIIVARDLTPSQTAAFDRDRVIGFTTDLGGQTSHTAIFARAMEIPAVVGVTGLSEAAIDGAAIIVDGDRGVVIIEPDDATLDAYRGYVDQRRTFQLSLSELADLPSVTRDEQPIELLGNIELTEEVPGVIRSGGEGIGLFRTEFLYLTCQGIPTEEDHFLSYRRAVESLDGRPLTIRTVDLGADKYVEGMMEERERNPALGLRSIRYSLQSLPMFKRQLRAVLRASAFGPVKIMFPLITSMHEFRQARFLLNDVVEDLLEEEIDFDSKVPVGMMVEVPSAAVMADTFAREVDFLSIGTNDLVQYTLAVDRTNERVAELYNPSHPAVIRLIKEVIRASRRREVPVSCCGEAAGELEYAILLIGLGLRTLSVTGGSIPRLKRLIRSVTIPQCERLARKASTLDSEVAVSAFLRDQARKIVPEAFDGQLAE